jgi:hypothetical protein
VCTEQQKHCRCHHSIHLSFADKGFRWLIHHPISNLTF